MSRHHAPRRLAALLVVGLALTSLTACSGIPFLSGDSSPAATSAPRSGDAGTAEDEAGDAGQSTAEACALVQETIEGATTEFENVSSEDPAAVVEAMRTAADRIAATASEVTNDEVAALLPSLQDMFQQVADVMGAISEGDVSKLADVEKLGDGFTETSQKFQELCAP